MLLRVKIPLDNGSKSCGKASLRSGCCFGMKLYHSPVGVKSETMQHTLLDTLHFWERICISLPVDWDMFIPSTWIYSWQIQTRPPTVSLSGCVTLLSAEANICNSSRSGCIFAFSSYVGESFAQTRRYVPQWHRCKLKWIANTPMCLSLVDGYNVSFFSSAINVIGPNQTGRAVKLSKRSATRKMPLWWRSEPISISLTVWLTVSFLRSFAFLRPRPQHQHNS